MEKCLNSKTNLLSVALVSIFNFIEGLIIALIGILLITHYPVEEVIVSGGIIALVGLALCALGILTYVVYNRCYFIDECGITVCYLKKFKVFYPWSKITEIAVCDINNVPKIPTHYNLVIRILVGSENKSRKNWQSLLNGIDRWRTDGYNLIRFRSVINLEYSVERLMRIQAVSHIEIKDMRSKYAK